MNIKTEVTGTVGIATLNRPEALNALNTALLNELADALEAWDKSIAAAGINIRLNANRSPVPRARHRANMPRIWLTSFSFRNAR